MSTKNFTDKNKTYLSDWIRGIRANGMDLVTELKKEGYSYAQIEEISRVCDCKTAAESHNGSDGVKHPNYYMLPNGIECIEVIRHFDNNTGNAIKYLWRQGTIGKYEVGMTIEEKRVHDLKKAKEYIDDLIDELEGKHRIFTDKIE